MSPPPMDDLDPPTFRFSRRGRNAPEEEPPGQEPDPDASQAEEAEPPQIRIERRDSGGERKARAERLPRWRRLPFARSETSARREVQGC